MDKIELRRRVGIQIRRYRESQNLSLQQLAGMVNTSYTHLWKVENAKVGVGLDLLGRIADALDVPLRDIVDPIDDGASQSGQTVSYAVRMPQLVVEYDGLTPRERCS